MLGAGLDEAEPVPKSPRAGESIGGVMGSLQKQLCCCGCKPAGFLNQDNLQRNILRLLGRRGGFCPSTGTSFVFT